MSYIRCLSNPESLYVWAESTGRAAISVGALPTLYMPYHTFHGLFIRWLSSGRDKVSYRGASLTQTDKFKWILKYNKWPNETKVEAFEVTFFYVAMNIVDRYKSDKEYHNDYKRLTKWRGLYQMKEGK